ncbi:MAG: MFS transporter [Dehalococcoidales bacterium]|nr:MAG: MFS transporter [Dehalococcoidales bacterium]
MAEERTRLGQSDKMEYTDEAVLATGKPWDWRTPFISLQNRNFRLFIIGSLVSTTALQMQQLAQNYLVYDLTGLATAIGYVSAAIGVSLLIFSLVGGIAADRMAKKQLMIIGQLGIAAVTLLLAILITTGLIQVWHIVVTSIVIGIIAAFTMPARQSYVPDLVGTEKLTNALALNAGMMNMTRIGGPALAGVLIGMFGVGPIYYVKVVAYGIFVAFLFLIPIAGKVDTTSTRSPLGDAIDGLRYLRDDRKVLELLILAMVPVILGLPYVNFLPVFQKEVFHLGPSALGWMMSAVGSGAVFGALVVASLGDYKYKGRILLGSGLGFGISLALFAVVANTGSFTVTLVILALTGATSTAYTALNNALVLTITPPEMRGRVMGVFMTTFGMMPLGALPMGALTDNIGAPLTTGIFGVLTLAFFVLATIFRPHLRRL